MGLLELTVIFGSWFFVNFRDIWYTVFPSSGICRYVCSLCRMCMVRVHMRNLRTHNLEHECMVYFDIYV